MTGTILGLGLLLVVMGGCASYTSQVDLNNDGRPDAVSGFDTEGHYFYSDYRLNQVLSQPDATHRATAIANFRGRPDEIQFEDVDGDGDLDLRCKLSSKTRWDHVVDGEYIAFNDGLGNFGELQSLDVVRAYLDSALPSVSSGSSARE